MAQHRTGQLFKTRLYMFSRTLGTRDTLNDNDVHTLDREDGWFERVKEAIYVKVEKPSLNLGQCCPVNPSQTHPSLDLKPSLVSPVTWTTENLNRKLTLI